jgi:hypothetical protein
MAIIFTLTEKYAFKLYTFGNTRKHCNGLSSTCVWRQLYSDVIVAAVLN